MRPVQNGPRNIGYRPPCPVPFAVALSQRLSICDFSRGDGRQRAAVPSLAMSAPSRNGPCPCGSGVKYKKCCLPKDEAVRAAPPRRFHNVDYRGRSLTVTGSPSRETLDLAADYFERNDADEGFAAQITRFSQPLIKAAGDNPVAIQNAMTLGALLWNVAIADEDVDAALADVMQGMSLSGEDAADFRSIAASMVERHRQMFPALHADRRERCASTED